MGLVTYALKFRITFYVMSILILLAGIGGYIVMPKDVLPEVNIPVVTIVWTYTGRHPEMEQRVTTYTEFALSNNVNGIRDMESHDAAGRHHHAGIYFEAGCQTSTWRFLRSLHRPTQFARCCRPESSRRS